MSSRADPRRRDRSWEREDRDRERGGDRDRYSRGGRDGRARGGGSYRDEPRRRSSRSRSPRRDRDGDRRDRRERDYRHGRDDDRRDRDRDRHADDRRRDRDDHRRDTHRKDDVDKLMRDATPAKEGESKDRGAARPDTGPSTQLAEKSSMDATTSTRPNLDPDAADHPTEEGEAMEEVNDEESAMLAMMGLNGFGSTKGKHVVGNQIGAVNIKKVRTWRQYMNRRGGFNRPLDKIK